MALRMARPWKHPKTGIYWLRKRVPEDLRPILGKREEKRSLQTRDAAEAKRRHMQVLTKVESQWTSLRVGPPTLTERESHELAKVAHDRWLEMHRDNPSEQTFWPTHLYGKLWAPPAPVDLNDPGPVYRLDPDWFSAQKLQAWCCEQADQCLAAQGMVVDEGSRLKLAKAIAAAVQRASLTLARYSQGDFGPEGSGTPHQPPERRSDGSHSARPVSFEDLLQGWAAETKPVPKTLYEWRRVLGQLATFVGHDDASRLTTDDLIAWKGQMIEAGLQGKTIRDGKLAPVRAVLRWAVANRRLGSNPAKRIIVDVKSAPGTKKRSFTDQEAATVLKAARRESNPIRRWVP